MIEKIASAVYNDIVSGLSGMPSTPTISILQLEDDVVDEMLQIIKEYSLKNLIPRKDLMLSINCINVDCKALDMCPCSQADPFSFPKIHFELPQIINDFAEEAIEFIGSTDKSQQYKVYTDTSFQFHKFLRRGADKPYVYIQTTPNENNMYDAWVFNVTPFLKNISVIAIFKDPRQLRKYSCCSDSDFENLSFIFTEVKKRLTEKKIRYYRQLYQIPTPSNQIPK